MSAEPRLGKTDTPLNIALLGTRHVHAGGLARLAIEAGAVIIGATENDAEARGAWARTGYCDIGTREQLLAEADAVIVAGTNAERVDDARAALDAGLPTLCEKPIAMTPDELAVIRAAAAGGRFMTALPVRFAASLQRAHAAIRAGAIGTPIAGRGTNHGQFPGGWFGVHAEAGGGAMMDHVVHLSDALCWLLDDRITDVYAQTNSTMLPSLDVESSGVVTMDFASGFFASVDSSWSRPQSFHTWGDVWLEIAGTEGRLVIDPMARHVELFDDSVGRMRTVGYDPTNMTGDMVQAFLTYAADGGDSPVSLDEGAHASDVVFAAYASAASGRRAPVDSPALAG